MKSEQIKRTIKEKIEMKMKKEDIVYSIRESGEDFEVRFANKGLTYQLVITGVETIREKNVPVAFFSDKNDGEKSLYEKDYAIRSEDEIDSFIEQWEMDRKEWHMMNLFSNTEYQGIGEIKKNLKRINGAAHCHNFIQALKEKLEVETDEELEVRLTFVKVSNAFQKQAYVVVLLDKRIVIQESINEKGEVEYS